MGTGTLMNRSRWLLICVLASASQVASAASDIGTLTKGSSNGGGCGASNHGYIAGLMGSYSPTGLTGGKTLSGIYDHLDFVCPSQSWSSVVVTGFASNPGASWLTSVSCSTGGGITGSGATYSYSAGTATWSFVGGTHFNLVGVSNGTNVTCTVAHN